jgi:transcriptional regulator with GAF, ATPase, and Fis domain/tetratricopeptide (TPR) repeat protein
VGPAAASWPVSDFGSEDELVSRLLELAREKDPRTWTRGDLQKTIAAPALPCPAGGADRIAWFIRELARPYPGEHVLALAEEELRRVPIPTLALELADALVRAGELGRAHLALEGFVEPVVCAERAEIARRRGDRRLARSEAEAVLGNEAASPHARSRAAATLARMAWDEHDLDHAERLLEGMGGPAVEEVRALIAHRRHDFEAGLVRARDALASTSAPMSAARLAVAVGTLAEALGRVDEALEAFGRAATEAARAGAVLEEATYRVGEAFAAGDAGDIGRALASGTRAALLLERLGRPGDAARAWLTRAAALAAIGAVHEADEAAEQATVRATAAGDVRAAAYARWAHVEVRPPGDPRAREEAILAARALEQSDDHDRLRAAARLLVWAPDAIDDESIGKLDAIATSASADARWEWWGARAHAELHGRSGVRDPIVELVALIGQPADVASVGRALAAGVELARKRQHGDAARRFETARREAAERLAKSTPPEWKSALTSVAWARTAAATDELSLAPAQVLQLESLVRSLQTRDRLKPLLEQVIDAMVLWTGVERGLLLLKAPSPDPAAPVRLVPRAARNLAREDLRGEQLALSTSIAQRALASGEMVVATDAFATLGDLHASVHALRLRSVLAIPLVARGETLGVIYLDDRAKRGAFGPGELSWLRLVASQAAMAIADARDQVLLRRAARRAERARARIAAELDQARIALESRDREELRFRYDAIAGRSEPMRQMLRMVDRVTASDVPVLVVGESGTGKELIARAMHQNGPRSRRAFVSENCASVPETLLESTLFGHVKGSFTGATHNRAGLFEVADGGSLFLDEIGEMPLAMQAKLLRVLQFGEIRPVGGDRTRRVDVRLIAATHRDLGAMVEKGTFREDLYYRLNVVTIVVPPLRERAEDIPLIVSHLVRKHAGERKIKITRAAMEKLCAYPWPGNVRQLENEIRRAIVLADGAIDVTDLSPDVARGGSSAARGAGLDLRSRVDGLEKELVTEALARTRGNQTKAAELLGLSRFGLQKMMKRLKIQS